MRLIVFALFIMACTGGTAPTAAEKDAHSSEHSHKSEVLPVETTPSPNGAKQEKVADNHYGAPFTLQTSLPAHTALSNPGAHTDKTIRLAGTITDVCQKKGCWMVIEDNGLHMRVLMKDHAFAVDMNAAGKTCDVEGTIVAKQENPAETAHYASESTPGTVIPEKEKEGKTVYQFHATGVQIAQKI